MNVITRTLRGLIGLFIDDGKLALTVLGVLVFVGVLAHFDAWEGWPAMVFLIAGTLCALLANVIHTAVSAPPSPARRP